jgi:hypothetical protein
LVGKANKNGINTGSKDPTSLVDKYDLRQYQFFYVYTSLVRDLR